MPFPGKEKLSILPPAQETLSNPLPVPSIPLVTLQDILINAAGIDRGRGPVLVKPINQINSLT